MFSKAGLDEGVAGHITVRDPAEPDTFWVNPFGMHFSMIRSSDLIRVDEAGEVVEGDRAVNGAAVAIHCAVHAARPDILAAAHAHGPYGKTLSAMEMTVEPLTQDACAFYQDIGKYDTYTGVVLDPEEGKRIGQALGDHKAVILSNHGMLTVGETVDSAAWWFLTLERTAQSQLMAYAAGTPRQIGHDEATQTRGQVGYELAGWFQFQPIWDRDQPRQPGPVRLASRPRAARPARSSSFSEPSTSRRGPASAVDAGHARARRRPRSPPPRRWRCRRAVLQHHRAAPGGTPAGRTR